MFSSHLFSSGRAHVTMAKCFIAVLVVALCLSQQIHGKATNKAKAVQVTSTERSTLDEIAASAQDIVQNVTRTLGIKELPDSKQVLDVLQNNTQALASHMQEIVDKLKTEVKAHQSDIDSVIKSVEEKLSQTAASLQQAAGPEATAKAKEMKDKLDNGLKTAVDQVDKLVKAVEPEATKAKENIQKVARTLLDQIVDLSTNLQTQVSASIQEHEKTHKN